jgi:hypothetical protein
MQQYVVSFLASSVAAGLSTLAVQYLWTRADEGINGQGLWSAVATGVAVGLCMALMQRSGVNRP